MQNNKYIFDTGSKNIKSQYSINIVEMNPATARCRAAACEILSTAVCYRFAARDILTKVHLQECSQQITRN